MKLNDNFARFSSNFMPSKNPVPARAPPIFKISLQLLDFSKNDSGFAEYKENGKFVKKRNLFKNYEKPHAG